VSAVEPQPGLTPLLPDQLDDAQRRLYDAVLASPRGQGGARRLIRREDGSLTGPFDAWLRTPALGEHLERVGMALRTDTVLPAAAREVAVLVVARAWCADFEWWVHGLVARGEGVPEAAIEAIGHGRRPEFDDPAPRAAHDVALELVERRRLAPETRERARAVLGERALVELVTLVGFYQLVSGILESFHPPGPSAELPVVGVPAAAERAGIDLYAAASTTRAVRRLRPDPIPDDVLRRVLRAATWAPSGGNLQPWHVIAVRDPARRKGLAELYRPLWEEYVSGRRALIEPLPDALRVPAEKALAAGDHLAEHLHEAPVINAFCFHPERLTITDADLGRPSVVGGASLYPAVQNLLLACRAEGLGCVLTTLLCRREKEVRELLEIPEPWATCAFVPIGWPVGGGHGPLSRRPVEQAAFADRFGDALFGQTDDASPTADA
jgi:nitroreductase/alkylhydroperoxidase family enzyme